MRGTARRRLLRCGLLATTIASAIVAIAAAGAVALPDGRGYELVSAEHQGFPTGAGPVFNAPNVGSWIEPGGGWLAYPVFDPFVGESGQPGTYKATRGADGWSNEGLFPVDAVGNANHNVLSVGLSADGTKLVLATSSALLPADTDSVEDLYLVNADKTLTLLTPGTDAPAHYAGRSADASHVVFETTSNLVPDASGTAMKLYEWNDGTIRLVGFKPDGTVDPGGSILGDREDEGTHLITPTNAVSPDGSQIAFESPAPSTAGGPVRVYLRIDGTTTVEASESQCTRIDCDAPADVLYAGAAKDGSRIFMITVQQLTDDDTDAVNDLYAYDVGTGALTRISAGAGTRPQGLQGNNLLGASDDGQRVWFIDPIRSVRLWDHGAVLPAAIGRVNTFTLSGVQDCAQLGTGWGTPEVSADGSAIAFSTTSFIPADPSGPSGRGFYHYSLSSGLTKVDDEGSLLPSLTTVDLECALRKAISDDGSYVFFTTPDAIVPQDVNGKVDVYEWHDGSIGLISSGVSDQDARLIGTTSSAGDVYFADTATLVPQDQDTVQDVYDARIGGGFPPPPPVPPDCVGDGCRAALASPPTLPGAGSASHAGPGNVHVVRPPAFAVGAVRGAAARRLARHGRLGLIVRIGAAGRLRVTAVARIGRHTRTVASLARRLRAGRVQLTLTLSRSARRQLARTRRLRLRIAVAYSGASHARRLTLTLSK